MEASWSAYWLVYGGLLLTGLGWGAVEAGTNPLVAAIYPEEKTHRLNILHAWWPAGIVAGGLLGTGVRGSVATLGAEPADPVRAGGGAGDAGRDRQLSGHGAGGCRRVVTVRCSERLVARPVS